MTIERKQTDTLGWSYPQEMVRLLGHWWLTYPCDGQLPWCPVNVFVCFRMFPVGVGGVTLNQHRRHKCTGSAVHGEIKKHWNIFSDFGSLLSYWKNLKIKKDFVTFTLFSFPTCSYKAGHCVMLDYLLLLLERSNY